MNSGRVLYHTPLSPFCRKARLALKEKGREFALTEQNPWQSDLKLFALNPAGEVPVLIEDDGRIIAGNYAICEYLEDTCRRPLLIGKTPIERAEVRRLVDWFDQKFDFEVTQKIVFEKVFRRMMDGSAPDSRAIRIGQENIHYHLDYIAQLTKDHNFLTGDEVSLADLAAAAHFSALDYLSDVPWSYNAKAAAWYALIKSRPSMRPILADRISGLRPPDHYEDPDF